MEADSSALVVSAAVVSPVVEVSAVEVSPVEVSVLSEPLLLFPQDAKAARDARMSIIDIIFFIFFFSLYEVFSTYKSFIFTDSSIILDSLNDSKRLLFTGNVPRGVFGEYRLQKNGESQREILKMHDFSASRSEP